MTKGKRRRQREKRQQAAQQGQSKGVSGGAVPTKAKRNGVEQTDGGATKNESEDEINIASKSAVGEWIRENSNAIIALFTVLITVIAALQGGTFWFQLKAMRIDQRPWVKFEQDKNAGDYTVTAQFTINQPLSFPIRFVNTGKTPAMRVATKVFIAVLDVGTGLPLEHPESSGIQYVTISGQTGVISANSEIRNVMVRPNLVTEQEFNGMKDGTLYFAAWGSAVYDDVFHKHHWTKFCYWLTNAKNYQNERCNKYNDIDPN